MSLGHQLNAKYLAHVQAKKKKKKDYLDDFREQVRKWVTDDLGPELLKDEIVSKGRWKPSDKIYNNLEDAYDKAPFDNESEDEMQEIILQSIREADIAVDVIGRDGGNFDIELRWDHSIYRE